MNHLQSTQIFETGVTTNPLDEILVLTARLHPTFQPTLLKQLHHDLDRLFAGTYPGFRACTTRYHNLKHTYSVALATARLLHGLSLSGQDISIAIMEQALYSAYFHDTGLLMKDTDQSPSGAIYTKNHEERSITIMNQYLAGNNRSPAFLQECAACIRCTNITSNPEDIDFPTAASKLAGHILGSADILAQMADRYYLERLPFLFQEHKEGGLQTHDSPIALMQDTSCFYHNIVSERLEKTFASISRAMQAHFRDRWHLDDNLYFTNITKNLDYLKRILHICENNLAQLDIFLKRSPEP